MGLCGGVWGIYAHGMDMTTEPAGAQCCPGEGRMCAAGGTLG